LLRCVDICNFNFSNSISFGFDRLQKLDCKKKTNPQVISG
jgi:hypothetical protein